MPIHTTGNTPAHGAESVGGSGAHDGARHTCVVLTGNPKAVTSCITAAATVWAANPSTGCIRTIRVPHRADDPPTPRPRSQADRERGGEATHVGTANSER